MNPISRHLQAIASGLAALGVEQAAEAEDVLSEWNAHVDAIGASDHPGAGNLSCFDCCNFEDGGIAAPPFCKAAEQIDTKQFFLPAIPNDVRQCQGFREDR